MMYIVMYYEDYEGYGEDEEMRAFFDKAKAKRYAKELNEKYEYIHNDKYEVIEIPIA